MLKVSSPYTEYEYEDRLKDLPIPAYCESEGLTSCKGDDHCVCYKGEHRKCCSCGITRSEK